MHRRCFCHLFIAAIASPLFANGLFAKDALTGCWLRSSSGAPTLGEPSLTSGTNEIDTFCHREAKRLNQIFGVKPSLVFYDNSSAENALATPERFDDTNPDGTVLLGKALSRNLFDLNKNTARLSLVGVMAHEWGHLLQFKNNFSDAWGVRHELSADYLAGWYLMRTRPRIADKKDEIAKLFASLGNTNFQHRDFHGSPSQRSMTLLYGAQVSGLPDGQKPQQIYDPNKALELSLFE